MTSLKRKILSLLLTVIMLFTIMPASILAQSENAQQANSGTCEWAGAMNFNNANNYVTTVKSMAAPNMTEMKWSYALNAEVDSYGAYYAGQSVIADGYLYATGGGKLHKVDAETGVGTIINDNAGSTVSYYDYLCYADGILILSTQSSLVAFDTDGTELGSISGSYGYYHPVQYHNGYVICNGFIYKIEKEGSSVAFTQIGNGAVGGDAFNWSSGAFVNDLFYVASKTTAYAVDYKTNTVFDSYVFDASRTATQNVQPGLCYDETTGRLFWATYTYDSYIHSVAIGTEEGETKGKFVTDSYISADAEQKSVATPVVYNGRVYLAGQQGRISVLNASDLTKVYDYVTLGGGKVQGNPILSVADGEICIYAQCYNGHLYKFVDNGDSGTAVKLAETKNYSKVLYPNAFEQYAMDKNGNIYCYNESGYLFCFGVSKCEVPSIVADLSEEQIKLAKYSTADALKVEAEVSDGGDLSYQWQISSDTAVWADIENAVSDSYVPATDTEGRTYYRCIVTNTNAGNQAFAISKEAEVLVKVLSSDTTLNVLVNGSNTLTSSNPQAAIKGADGILYVTNRSQKVSNLWVGTLDDAVVSSFEILHGLSSTATMPKFTKKSPNVYDGVTYNGYYRSTSYTLPIVAKAEVTAEDGVTKAVHYIVIDADDVGQYVISVDGFTSENKDYFSEESGLTFTSAGQQAVLALKKTFIGTGETGSEVWTWNSSDLTVANVDENGMVTCIGGGSATITASCGRVSAVCAVNSTAEKHSVHSYTEGVCSVCGTKEPDAVSAKFTLINQEGRPAVSKDGSTELYKTAISVDDADFDGNITLNDAFVVLHTKHSQGGADDFSSSDGYMSKLWGVTTYNVGYLVNNTVPTSLLTTFSQGDEITAFFYIDTTDYSDLYTFFDDESLTVSANNNTIITVNGLSPMASAARVPKGATVNVFKENGEEVPELSTKTDAEGKFSLSFTEAGTYTVQVSGNCSYTGSVWDYESMDYKSKDFAAAPVILSRMQVVVMPYAEATVYVTISDSKGKFSVGKNGEEMYRYPVKATDNPESPDGKVSILEVITAAHKQYHPDGEAAFVANNGFITHLWGVNTGGSIGYYFNDVYLSGSGTKTGTNGREFKDKLLDTVVADGDCYNIYALQDTKKWTDVYTYFAPVSQSAVAGKTETITARAATYSGEKVPVGAVVTVTDSKGAEQVNLNTTVAEDGTFKITFPAAGIYTAEIGNSKDAYYVPSRCMVYVSAATQGGSSGSEESPSVYISVKDPNGKAYHKKTAYDFKEGETAYSLLLKTGLTVKATKEHQYDGVYIESIEGLGEFDEGKVSGWMYKVNGEFPDYSASLYELSEGDYVEWVYTRDLGEDVGEKPTWGSTETKNDKKEEKEDPKEEAQIPAFTESTFPDVKKDDWHYESVKYVYENKLMQGTDSGFEPESKMTRAMLVTVLFRMANPKNSDSKHDFKDVPQDQWYSDAVSWAAANGIISGISKTQFAPDSDVTREQMALIIYRFAKLKGYDIMDKADISSFADADGVSGWALDAIKWANKVELLTGTSKTTLSPKDTATRAEVATILMRFCEMSTR